jgi:hypothetical protein
MSTMPNKSALQAALESVEMGPEAQEAIANLQAKDLLQIDQLILSALDQSWKKAGLIAAGIMLSAPDEYEELPEAFYVQRMAALAQSAKIEVKGELGSLKTCEIRLIA